MDGCAGHSDGDIVAHAITDAVLSAAGLGDIGGLLGTDDPRWSGAHGTAVLEHVRQVLDDAGWQVGNVAVQLIATTPKLGPRRAEAEAALSVGTGRPGQRHGHDDRRARAHRPRRGPGRGGDRAGGAEIRARRARRLRQ